MTRRRLSGAGANLSDSVRIGGAIGLGFAGAVLTVAGAWVADDGPTNTAPHHSLVSMMAIILLSGLGAVLADRILGDHQISSRAARAVVVFRGFFTIAVLVAAALLIWFGVGGVTFQLHRGFAYSARVLVIGGAIASALAVLVPLGRRTTGLHSHRPTIQVQTSALVAIITAVVVIAVGTLVGKAAPGWGVSGRTVAAEQVPPIPASVSRQVWSTPVAGTVTSAVAAGPGVVLSTGRRIESLHGRDGHPRWSYQHEGTVVANLSASPDGKTVAALVVPVRDVTSSIPSLSSAPMAGRVVVLNANTGHVQTTISLGRSDMLAGDISSPDPANQHPLLVTRSSLVVAEPSPGPDDCPGSLKAFSLKDGRLMWGYSPSGGAQFGCSVGLSGVRAVPAGLLVTTVNPVTGVQDLRLVDPKTGLSRWGQALPWKTYSTALGSIHRLYVSPDGADVAFLGAPPQSPNTLQLLVLNTTTGAILHPVTAPDPGDLGALYNGQRALVTSDSPTNPPRVVDLSTGRPDGSLSPCARDYSVAVLAEGSVCPHGTGFDFELNQPGGHSATVRVNLGDPAPSMTVVPAAVAAPGAVVAYPAYTVSPAQAYANQGRSVVVGFG